MGERERKKIRLTNKKEIEAGETSISVKLYKISWSMKIITMKNL